MTTSSPLVIGIDGGGTKTVAWLALHKPEAQAKENSAMQVEDFPSLALQACEFLGRGIAGPGNPRAVGFDVAQANIDGAIDAAFADAKVSRQTVAAACFGLAGCGRAEEQQQMTAWAQSRHIARMVKVTGDAEPILAAASPDNCGVALICGTGSLAWGRNELGETARAGGWGYLIGDEGSGYAIALAGLKAAVRSADGRGPETILLSRFQQQLDAARPEDLIGRIYAPAMTREMIASLAVTIFEAATTDALAREIVARAASDLAAMVAALVERLGFSADGYSLALAGSVVLHQPEYRRLLRDEITARSARPSAEILVAEPVAGAVALARQLATRRKRDGES